jgi:hypothetical protein
MISLNVVTIRDGRDGSLYDKEAILAGKDPLMARSKVRFDLVSAKDLRSDPSVILYSAYAWDKIDIAFRGDTDTERLGDCWQLTDGKQGVGQLEKTNGYTFVLKYLGQGAGIVRNNTSVRVQVGDEVYDVNFPVAD